MTGSPPSRRAPVPVVALAPSAASIVGVTPVVRTFHHDPRGFLLETLRTDDAKVDGDRFRMSYSSLTLPGQFRDADRWHLHQVQTDRFVVVLGEMMLALLDHRPSSPTHGRLEVLRMVGAAHAAPASTPPKDVPTYLVPIPPGVLHCIGNLGSEPFLLQNYPTELYNPGDEGRVPFASVPVASIAGPFAWNLVRRQGADGRAG
jgi:dTDP-4-dehydrorhamnose 3,5-epimerase-like enzyme